MKPNKEHFKELSEKIESGEYFSEARDWYLKKYEQTFIERAYLQLLIIAFIILFMFVNSYHKAIQPIKKSLPVKVTISDAGDFSTRMTYLGNAEKKFDVNDIFIKYFSDRFVEAIESYDYKDNFKKLRVNKNIIDALASEDIKAYYFDKISIRNEDSIILKYRRKIKRVIDIDAKKTEIAPYVEPTNVSKIYNTDEEENNDIKKYEASIFFEASEISDNGEITKSKWQAKILLSFQSILYNYEKKDFNPLNFKVLNYESKRVD